jgi:teichuronic acid exporter
MSSPNLDKTFAGGVAWTAAVKYTSQIVTWGSLLITAHLLSPDEYGISEKGGIFAIVTAVLAEFGVGTAVLQLRELPERTIRQLHTYSCLIGVAAFALSLAAIPLLTWYFRLPGLGLLFAINNLFFIITGLQAVPNGLLMRDLDYRKMSMLEATLVLVQAIGTVLAAYAGWSFWAPLAGALTGRVVSLALLLSWKPLSFMRVHWDEIRPALRLGGQVAISRLAWSTYTQADGIVIGRVLGDGALGSYRMSMNLSAAPAEKTSTLLMRAAGPLFARVQSDLDQVRRYFLILSEMLLLILLPLLLGLALVAPEAVAFILAPKWKSATVPLQWLALYMTFRPLGTLSEQVLVSQRQTQFNMRMSVVSFCILPLGFLIAATWQGAWAVAAAWLVLTPITFLPTLAKVLRTIQLPLHQYLAALSPAFAGCLLMVPAVWFVRATLLTQNHPLLLTLAGEVATGALVYAAVLVVFFRPRLERYLRFARDLRNKA